MRIEKNISVYVVDDNEVFLKTLTLFLDKCFKSEINIEAFAFGEDCFKKIQQKPETAADIVILDYHLNTDSKTAMNGFEVLKKIKKVNSAIIVIMLSAEDKLNIATDCITYGAYDYVVKSESAFVRIENILKNILEREFSRKILTLTMSLLEKHPELNEYLVKIQKSFPTGDDQGKRPKNLKEYFDSLDVIIKDHLIESDEPNERYD